MGFFDRVKKAFGGGKSAPEEPAATKDDQAAVTTEKEGPTDPTPAANGENVGAPAAETSATTTAPTSEPVANESAPKKPASAATRQTKPEPEPEQSTEAEETAANVVTDASEDTTSVASEQPVVAKQPTTAEKSVNATQPVKPEQPANDEAAQAADSKNTTAEAATEAPVEPASTEEAASPAEKAATTESSTSSVEASATPIEPTTATAEEATSHDYNQGLAKSRHGFAARLNQFLAGFRAVDEDFFDNLEEMLIEADVGFETAMTISDQLRDEVKLQNAKTKQQVGLVIVEKMVDLYGEAGAEEDNQLHFAEPEQGPTVFLFVGVNGAGKTTTIGKLSAQLKAEGKKVLLAAGDTFRAGAIAQLATWAERVGVDVVTSEPGADPASVVFEAVKKAKAEHYDILLVDTAGRLQNKVNLMSELAKMKRVIVRELPQAPQEVLLVLDASTGQNALNQAKQFQKTTAVTGIVLTKLDGSSKGGIVIAIRNELHLPVKLVGLGEHVGDLQAFDAEKFVYGLFKGLIDGTDA